MFMRRFPCAVLVAAASALLILSCAVTEESYTKEPGKSGGLNNPAVTEESTIIKFTDFTSSSNITPPEITVTIIPEDHPRLFADTRTLKLFAKSRGEGAFEGMLSMARKLWEEPGLPDYSSTAPGILAVSAFASANREYLSLATKEIDRALAPREDFTGQLSLERITWAAIGWDVLGGMMSVPDKETIANTARLALDEDLLPFISETLSEQKGRITQEYLLNEAFVRAFVAAFLWELVLADDEESVGEILESSFPILINMQEGLAVHLDEADIQFINGPVDDGLFLACMAWERASGTQLTDRKLLGQTLEKAFESINGGLKQPPQEIEDDPDINAAFEHLMKWRGILDEENRKMIDEKVQILATGPQVLLHIFLKQGNAAGLTYMEG